jgi:hypothetical protein
MDTDLLNGNLRNIVNLIAAAGGLGAAAMGLVDALKAFGGGPSCFGFDFIKEAVERFLPRASGGPTAFGRADILRTLQANWINGAPKYDQKARAKALIHLRLTHGDARALAALAGVDPATLQAVATKAMTGDKVTPQEIAVLGRFDAVLIAVLDEAYERADQRYRNASKLLAVALATIMAVCGGAIIYAQSPAATFWGYFGTSTFILAVLVGLSAAPIAPVAKDLASSLQAAVGAVGAARRLVP